MRIGVVIKHCQRKQSSHFLLELLPYLTKRHKIDIFTSVWDEYEGENVTFHKIPAPIPSFILQELFFSILGTFIMKFRSFDVTWTQPSRFLSPDVAHMEFSYKGWIEYKKRMGLSLTLAHRLAATIERRNLRRCKHVIVTSTGIKNEIMKYHRIPEDKITVIPNGVNTDYFKPDSERRERLKKKFKLKPNDIVILFVGRNLKRKGLEYLIQALHLIKRGNVKLFVCGGKDAYHDELVKKLGEKKRVVFFGDVSNIKDYYLISDIFVFPTFYEGFSFVTLQASACGLPIIATIANGTDDLIEDGKNGYLLDSRNPKLIADKIKILIENKPLRGMMGREARKIAINKFSWDVISKQIAETIEKIAG